MIITVSEFFTSEKKKKNCSFQKKISPVWKLRSPFAVALIIQVFGHGLLAFALWQRAQHCDVENKAWITSFYMFIWKVINDSVLVYTMNFVNQLNIGNVNHLHCLYSLQLFYAEYFLIPFVQWAPYTQGQEIFDHAHEQLYETCYCDGSLYPMLWSVLQYMQMWIKAIRSIQFRAYTVPM